MRKRYLLAALVTAMCGILLHTAWPFLFYPQRTLTFSLTGALPQDDISTAQAGVAERDITPPIGLPKFGYSAWAKPADGFRTRLKARAFYLQGSGQTPLALVQLDLGSGSLVLHHRVAELISEHTDVPPHALTLLVTHTHSGPGQYLGSDFYNVFGSNRPGFDPALFEFLSQRIAEAVIAAYQSRAEARFAVGQSDLFGYTRNRSVAAWANNFPDMVPHNADPMDAVNPTMTMLRIDQKQGDRFVPAGALSLYSIHGTAIPPFTRPYHADVWHWISEELETALHDSAPGFIHGAAQATHADNNPAWKHDDLRGDREAERIGKALGQHATRLFQALGQELSPVLTTAVASRQLNLLDRIDTGRFGLCERAITGASVAGAANGDEVFPISYLPFLEEGWPRRLFTDQCQGVKQWMLSKLQLLLPAERFPHQALFQIVRINDLVLVPLPWEITLESGNRLRDAVTATLPPGTDWKVEISSLANGYFGYAVTPEEYQLQYYEGGHTLYGPHTLDFLIGQSEALSRDLQQHGDLNAIPPHQSWTLLSRHFFPDKLVDGPRRWLSKPQHQDGEPTTGPYWQLTLEAEASNQLRLNRPMLAVHCGSRVISDDSAQLQLRHRSDSHDSTGTYEVRWYPAEGAPVDDCRFAVRTGRQTLFSDVIHP